MSEVIQIKKALIEFYPGKPIPKKGTLLNHPFILNFNFLFQNLLEKDQREQKKLKKNKEKSKKVLEMEQISRVGSSSNFNAEYGIFQSVVSYRTKSGKPLPNCKPVRIFTKKAHVSKLKKAEFERSKKLKKILEKRAKQNLKSTLREEIVKVQAKKVELS